MMLIVCPFSRPERLEHVLRMWERQYTRAELVLVANERGNWARQAEEAGAVVLTRPASIGEARNIGLDYARGVGADWAVFWDDDNYYGGFYLREIERAITPEVDVLSLGIGFVRFEDGLYCFESGLSFCPGHSTAVRVSAAPRFPELSFGEDVEWSKGLDMSRVRQLPPWHHVYDRTGEGHAYPAPRELFIRAHGPARFVGDERDDFVDLPRDVSRFPLATVTDEEIVRGLERSL